MGKKLSAAIVGVLLAVGLVAAPPAQANSKQNDNLFVELVRQEAPELRFVKKRQMVKAAKQTCRYLRSGGTILESVAIALDSGLSRNTAMALVAGAVVFYCPEQENNY